MLQKSVGPPLPLANEIPLHPTLEREGTPLGWMHGNHTEMQSNNTPLATLKGCDPSPFRLMMYHHTHTYTINEETTTPPYLPLSLSLSLSLLLYCVNCLLSLHIPSSLLSLATSSSTFPRSSDTCASSCVLLLLQTLIIASTESMPSHCCNPSHR